MSISAHGGGLINGIAGMENKFTVFTSGKPVSGLTVAFEGELFLVGFGNFGSKIRLITEFLYFLL